MGFDGILYYSAVLWPSIFFTGHGDNIKLRLCKPWLGRMVAFEVGTFNITELGSAGKGSRHR